MAAIAHAVGTGSATEEASNRRAVQAGLLFAASVATAISGLGVSLLFPATDSSGLVSYATARDDGGFVWVFLTLASANLVLTVVAVGLAGLLLAPARGWRWVTCGFGLAVLGSGFYAAGVGGWAMVYYFGANSNALDPATASAFVESVNDDAFRVFAAAGAGAIGIALGTVLFSIGLWRAGSVPRWVLGLGVVGAIVTFVLPTDGVIGVLVESPQAVSSALIGWYAWARTRGRGASAPFDG